jgi:beta-lactamase class D
LSAYFENKGVIGSFLLYDAKNNEFIRYCQNRCDQRYIPASTFKLLNAQIALEAGAVEDKMKLSNGMEGNGH